MKQGYARVWSGPKSNPNLDFTDFRKNHLFEFSLSADGTRAATATHDGMIRLWNTDSGAQIVAYSAAVEGSHRLALSAFGTKIASSSPNGTVSIRNPEFPPSDADVSIQVGNGSAKRFSFSPDGSRLLVSLKDEVQIWHIETRQKCGQMPSSGCLDTSFSVDGELIIIGNSKRTTIWDAAGTQIVFDTAVSEPQAMSLSEAKNAIRTCGPSAHRRWPSSFRTTGAVSFPPQSATNLTVDNIFSFVFVHQPCNMQFCKDIFVSNDFGLFSILKLFK